MARARFTADFKWPALGPWHIAYKAGTELTVKREVLDAAIAAGAAVDLEASPPPLGEGDREAVEGADAGPAAASPLPASPALPPEGGESAEA